MHRSLHGIAIFSDQSLLRIRLKCGVSKTRGKGKDTNTKSILNIHKS